MSMWLLKCPVPIRASLQISIARRLVVESRRRQAQVGSPRVVATAWRLISTVTRASDAGRCPSSGVTVPAKWRAIGATSARGSVCGLIQPRKDTLTLPPLTTSACATPNRDSRAIPISRAVGRTYPNYRQRSF